MISYVMDLLEDPIGVNVTVGASGGAVDRPGLRLGAGIPGVAVIVLAQGVLGVVQRAVHQPVRQDRKNVGSWHRQWRLDTGDRHQLDGVPIGRLTLLPGESDLASCLRGRARARDPGEAGVWLWDLDPLGL
ncbi:hypothetical protein KM043_001226 [Ampulex compressa]|nr:hypothetical protein KM043_001226 [Ampulex compressa]